MGQSIFILGCTFVVVGLMLMGWERMGIAKLPGDILIKKGNVTVFFPIATMLIVSVVLTVIANLFRR